VATWIFLIFGVLPLYVIFTGYLFVYTTTCL